MASELEINLIHRMALGDMARRRAVSHANREAIVEFVDGQRQSLTYGEFNRRVNRFVWALRSRGLAQGDRVAILGGNSGAFLTALMGCFKGGFVAVPVNFLQNPRDVAYNIDHSGAVALLADTVLHPLVRPIAEAIKRDVLLASLSTEGGAGQDGFVPFDELLEGQSEEEIEDVIIDDDDLAQIMYTSGTTARPKGVMASHKSLFVSTLNSAIELGVNSEQGDTAAVLPLFHITAEMMALTSVHVGSKLVLLRGFEPAVMPGLIESERLNWQVLLPLMWKALLAVPGVEKHDYSSMHLGLYGMAPMDAATLGALRETFGCKFQTGSGQTETAAITTTMNAHWTANKVGNYWGDGSVVSDQAIMGDDGKLLPTGEVGEIVWRGPVTMLGYYQNEEATEEAQAYGWHHSGDLGFIDEDNQFCFVDRKKDIVKSGGENVSSVKVERRILALEGVANVGVIGLPHPQWSEAVTAVVAPAPGVELTEEAVIAHCKGELGGFEVPKRVIFVEELPMTATGKVKKHDLRDRYGDIYEG